MRNEDAAKRHAITRYELVHVIAVACSDVREEGVCCKPFIGHGHVPFHGKLDIVDGAFDD
ncbi:hypothetical protein D3C86_2017420 [compost metagenome]